MAKLKILIVEDEVLIALDLQSGLNQAGYDVCGAVTSGEEAIEIAKQAAPDLALVDIRLLGAMDGIEAARQISAISSAKIIFITGYRERNLKERATALNPLAYLTKPIEWHELEAVIRSSQVALQDPE